MSYFGDGDTQCSIIDLLLIDGNFNVGDNNRINDYS